MVVSKSNLRRLMHYRIQQLTKWNKNIQDIQDPQQLGKKHRCAEQEKHTASEQEAHYRVASAESIDNVMSTVKRRCFETFE